MYRVALRAVPRSVPAVRSTLRLSLPRSSAPIAPKTASLVSAWRGYASSGGLDRNAISARVLDVLKTFEKVDGGKLTPNSAFTSDLGLDSLDAVEVVMAIEEEFGVEIPDAEADEITSVAQAIDYIAKTPEAH